MVGQRLAGVGQAVLTTSVLLLTGCGVAGIGAQGGQCGIAGIGKVDGSEGDADYVGLTVEEAEQLASSRGFDSRVLGRDGECADRTDDRRPRRVNFYVEDAKVKAATSF